MTALEGSDLLIASLAEHGPKTGEEVHDVAAELIRDGSLAVGTRLPTIRQLAQRSGLSTRVIVAAWGSLRREGLIETKRRGGTVVAGAAGAASRSWAERDLLTGSPDHDLQPDLTAAMLAGLRTEQLNNPGREYITDRLRDAMLANWPFRPESMVTASGGSEGLLLAVEAAAAPNSLVAVEEPVIPGFLDTLAEVGCRVIGIESDECGARAESLADALRQRPSVVVLQPEGAYSEAGSLTSQRATELAAVLAAAEHRPWIVEDDAIGPLAHAQAPSLGAAFPDTTVRVRSYCKAYGMDLKTCVIGGSAHLIERAIRLRVHGIAANSRILQNALVHLVSDPDTRAVVATARTRYRTRRTALVEALRERGVAARSGPNSLVVWVEVKDETGALIELARLGISVGPGARSFVGQTAQGRLRIAVPQLPDDPHGIAELADAVAAVAGAVHREFLD
ncbi:aminotransferase class I/II-fold pyridoxal phosphate-dependent enzyme [Nocardia miyunensis]|uniref:aminotransferase class I/II-fold pyridoxal phosphate-dependent enzyme n=1 Tax=Nocardia miyunensis TaxID=282684 RepID=UPI0008366B49|nr:aminotransferase class I/II-fold pyridoxal phosphate-dependent enzyme [Nocardia miyunensis]